MSIRCKLGAHDWEVMPHMIHWEVRVCLRCHRKEVAISTGGGWGGWQEMNSYLMDEWKRDQRRQKAKDIIADKSGASKP